MVWLIFEIILSASIIAFCARSLFFLKDIYPRHWIGGISVSLFFVFHFLASFLFPNDQQLYKSTFDYFLESHVILILLPAIFAITASHVICLGLLRNRSTFYSWRGNLLTLTNRDGQISIRPEDIISVKSMIYLFHTSWFNPMKLFKVKTTKGTFSFDEALEENYWRESDTVSFWSLNDGVTQGKRNRDFYYGKARATSYFQENFTTSSKLL